MVAILSSNQLVLLARVSFAGTAILAPFVLAAVLTSHRPGIEIIISTAFGLMLFLASVLGLIPEVIGTIRLDLMILLSLSMIAGASVLLRRHTHHER